MTNWYSAVGDVLARGFLAAIAQGLEGLTVLPVAGFVFAGDDVLIDLPWRHTRQGSR